MEPSTSSDNVKVAIRVRQLIQKEVNSGLKSHWTVRNDTITCNEPDSFGRTIPPYIFDRVFDETSITMDLFEDICQPIVDKALEGINGTIFAYGQSSSGKTFTMLGTKVQPGIISLAIGEIFNKIDNMPDREFLIRVGYIEIYNERVSDLLSPTENYLKLQEDTDHNVQVVGLTEEVVNDQKKLLDVIQKGNAKRHTAETKQNDRSSRSHCILRIVIESRQIGREDDAVMVSNLYFVDLAGSEKAGDNSGDRFREGCAINKSLFTLGMVIRKLTGDTSQQHVSFRDSKLTRILKNALGGNSKTAIICNMTPAHIEESDSTLKFASRAKNICNKPTVNEVMSDEALLKRYRSTINKLQNQIKEMSTTNVSMEKAELERRLQEKEAAQKEQADMISKLQTMIVTAGPIIQEPPKKKRRETWCPGKTWRPLPVAPKLSTSPQPDKMNITDIMTSASPVTVLEEEMPSNMLQAANETINENPTIKELFELQDKYEYLKEELDMKNQELIELQDFTELERQMEIETIKELRTKIQNLEESQPWMEEELMKTQQERNSLRQKVESLNMRLSAVEDGSGITAKAQKLSETETKLEDLNKELKLQISRSEFHTEQMKRKIESLTLILEEKGVEPEFVKQRLGSTDYMEDGNNTQMDTKVTDIEELRKEIDSLLADKAEKEIEVQELQVYKEKFEEQDTVHQKALEDAKEETDIYRQLYEEEAKKNTGGDAERMTSHDDKDKDKEMQELKQKLEASQKTVAENDKDFEELMYKFESEKSEMKNTIKELEKQLDTQPTADSGAVCDMDKDRMLELLKEEYEKKEEEVQELKSKLETSGSTESDNTADLDSLLLQYKSENTEMKVKIEELEKRLDSNSSMGVTEQLIMEDRKLEMLKQEFEKKEEEILKLKLKLEGSEKSVAENNTDNENLLLQYKSENSEMKVKIEELEKRLEASTCAVTSGSEVDSQMELLKQEYVKKEEEIQQLKSILEEKEKIISVTENGTELKDLIMNYESESLVMKNRIEELTKQLETSTAFNVGVEERMDFGEERNINVQEYKEEVILELKSKLEASEKIVVDKNEELENLISKHESEMSEMKRVIEERHELNQTVSCEADTVCDKNGDSEIELLKQREEEINVLRSKLEVSEKTVIDNKTDHETILVQYESYISEMKIKIEELEKRLETNSAESVQVKIDDKIDVDGDSQLELLKGEIEKREVDIREMRLKLEASDTYVHENCEMKNRIEELEKQLESRSSFGDCASETLAANDDSKSELLKQECEKKEEEILELKSKLEAGEKSLSDSSSLLIKYETEHSEMKNKIKEQEQMLECSPVLGNGASENVDLERDMLKQECIKKEEEILELKSKLEASEISVDLVENENLLQYKSENSEIKVKIDELQNRLESNDGIVNDTEEDGGKEALKQQYESTVNDLKQQIVMLERILDSQKSEGPSRKRRKHVTFSLTSDDESHHAGHSDEKPLMVNAEQQTSAMLPMETQVETGSEDQNSQTNLQGVLEETQAELHFMREQLQKLSTEIDQLHASKAALKAEKRELLVNNEMMQEKMELFEEDLVQTRRKLNLAEEKLEELKTMKEDEKIGHINVTEEKTEEINLADELRNAAVEKNVNEEKTEEINLADELRNAVVEINANEGEAEEINLADELRNAAVDMNANEGEAEGINLADELRNAAEDMRNADVEKVEGINMAEEMRKAAEEKIEELKKRVDQSEEELQEVREKLTMAEEKMEEMKKRLDQSQEELEEATANLNMAEEKMKEMEKLVEENLEDRKLFEENIEEMKKLAEEEVEEMKKRVDQSEVDALEAQQALYRAQEDIEEMKNLADKNMEEINMSKTQNEKLMAEKQELLQAIEDLQMRADQSEEDLKDAQRKLNMAEERMEDMRNMAEEKIEEIKKGELVESQAELETMRGQIKQLCEDIEQLHTDKATLTAEKHELDTTNELMQERVEQLGEDLNEAQKKANLAEVMMEDMKSMAVEKMEEFKQMLTQNEKIESEKQELLQAVEVLQEKIDQSEEDLKETQRKLNLSEEKVEEMKTLAEEKIEEYKKNVDVSEEETLQKLKLSEERLIEMKNLTEEKIEEYKKRLDLREQELQETQSQLHLAEKKLEEMKKELDQLQTENLSLKDDVIQYEANMPPNTIKVDLQTDGEWEKKWIELTREEKKKRILLISQIRELRRNLKHAELGVQKAKERALQELLENGKEKEIIAQLEQKWQTADEDANKLNWELHDEKKTTAELRMKIAILEKQHTEMKNLEDKKSAFISTDDHNCKYKMDSVKANMELKDFKYEMEKKKKAHEESVQYYNDKIAELKNEMRRLASGMDSTVCMMSSQPVKLEFGSTDTPTVTVTNTSNTEAGSSVRSGIVDHFKVCITENENKRLKKELEQQKALTGREDELNKENSTLKKEIKKLKDELKKNKLTTPLKTLNSPSKKSEPLSHESMYRKATPTLLAPSIAEMKEAAAAPQPAISSDFFNMARSSSTQKPLSTRKNTTKDNPDNCKTT